LNVPTKGKQPITPADLDQLSNQLRDRAAELTKLARRMEKNGLKSVEAMGMSMADRGLEAFHNLYINCLRHIG
jgi:hypothetical protein